MKKPLFCIIGIFLFILLVFGCTLDSGQNETTGNSSLRAVETPAPTATPSPDITVYYCDVDAMSSSLPTTIGGNLNSKIAATNEQLASVKNSDDSRWTTPDPGYGDEVFLWVETPITVPTANISGLHFTFEGYLSNSSAAFSIWARNVSTNLWDQVGTTQSIATGSDGTITRSLTANLANYLSGGKLIWGVYETTSSQCLNVDRVSVVLSTDTPTPTPFIYALPIRINAEGTALGRVTVSPADSNGQTEIYGPYDTMKTFIYSSSTVVTLTAAEGFAEWQGLLTGSQNPTTVSVSGSLPALTARFTESPPPTPTPTLVQVVSAKGYVYDQVTNIPISGAIVAMDTSASLTTSSGYYAVSHIYQNGIPSSVPLWVSAEGYQDVTVYVSVPASGLVNHDIYLTPSATPTPTSSGATCSSPTSISIPYTKDGASDLCLSLSTVPSYINSWNLQSLTVNGVDFTNKWVSGSSLPAKINNLYYIRYVGSYSWSHMEIR